jgi:hypothetical protein
MSDLIKKDLAQSGMLVTAAFSYSLVIVSGIVA